MDRRTSVLNMTAFSEAELLNEPPCLCQSSITLRVLPIVYSAMFLAGVPGNVLSLWVFMVRIAGKTPTHIFLINLGISNLMLCLTMPFIAAYYIVGSTWAKPSLPCQLAITVLTPVIHTNIGVGVLILTWLALSRFATLIRHNYGHRPSRCTKFLPKVFFKRLQETHFASVICLGTWVAVATGIIPSVVIYSVSETGKRENDTEQPCYGLEVEVGGSGSQAFGIVAIVVFFLCLLLVVSAYMAVIRHFHRSSKSTVIPDRQKVYTRVVRNVVVIQGVLVICLLPHHVYKAVFIDWVWSHSHSEHLAECHPLSVPVEVKNLLLCLAALRSSTDPVIYFLLDRTFKRNVLGLLRMRANTSGTQSQFSKSPDFEQLDQYECGTLGKAVGTGIHAKDSENIPPSLD